MNISKNTTRTYVVTSLPATSPADVTVPLSSGQVAVFNVDGKSNAASPEGAYFTYKIGSESIATNKLKASGVKSAVYKKYSAPSNQVDVLKVVLPVVGDPTATKGDYFAFIVRQDPGSVPSSVNAVFPMAAYTAIGGETPTEIAAILAKNFNVSVSIQFDSPILATSSADQITLTAQNKAWDLYAKPYKLVTFKVTQIDNIQKVSSVGPVSGQGVGKAIAELEELTYGYSVTDRVWSAGLNAFRPDLLARADGTYDVLTINYVGRESVTEETVIPSTYIFAIDSTLSLANKNALVTSINLLLGTSIPAVA